MSIILYPQENNKLAVVYPTGEASISQLIATAVPPGSAYLVVEELAIFDPLFDAYDFSAETGAVFNPEKAAAIQRNRWREARKPLLRSLDIDFLKADEQGDTEAQAAIAAQKQALRDVTLSPIESTDPEGIYNTWPAILS